MDSISPSSPRPVPSSPPPAAEPAPPAAARETPSPRTQPAADRAAADAPVAASQRAALAGINGASGFDSNPGAPTASNATGPRREIDMTRRVFGSPHLGPGYSVTESERDREARTDGKIQGADGRLYEPERGRGIDGIPPVMPADPNQVTNPDPVLAIYGVNTNAATAAENNQELANAINRPVIGVRNATRGATPLEDFAETLWDQKVNNAPIPAVRSAADIITDRLAQDRPLEIHAHSQGAVVTSQAIALAREQLIRQHGLTPQQADERLRLLTVHTYGGAAASYPDGPQYTHHINRLDPVPATVGLGVTGLDMGTRPGRGATINRQTHLREPHGFRGYLDWVHPPGQRVQR